VLISGFTVPRFPNQIRSAAVATACPMERISLRVHHHLDRPVLISGLPIWIAFFPT